MKILKSDSVSTGFKELFWEIFFVSKGRGVSLLRHFPWLNNVNDNITYVEAQISGITIAGLVLKKIKYKIDSKEITIGLIGLVCVAQEYRGRGVASQLLTSAIEHSKRNEYDFLTLWTSQHRLYEQHGFYLDDLWQYGWVQTEHCIKKISADHRIDSEIFMEDKLSPLPPFATSIYRAELKDLSFKFVKDNNGYIVVDFEGNPDDLAIFMINSLPGRWRLNAVKNSPLVAALENEGADTKLIAANLQMWLNLNYLNSIGNKIYIPFLDRI